MMIANDGLRWVLSVVFGGLAGYHLLQCLRRPTSRPSPMAEHWLSEVVYLVMGLSMLAMIWPWRPAVPDVAWVVIFTVSTGWFLIRAVSALSDRVAPVLSAVATGVMVWMVASMPRPPSAGGHGGMDMAGMGHVPVGGAGWAGPLLGGYLVLAACWWVGRAMRIGRLLSGTNAVARPLDWSALCHGVMSAGMGMALLAMT
jgi:hypothetical protein